MILVLALLLVKHYLADFPLQNYPYLWQHKSEYGHPGGLLHSAIQAVLTIPFCIILGAWWLVPLEFLVHYHVDFLKMYFNKKYSLTQVNPAYWNLLGADQLVHGLFYIFMIICWFKPL